MSLPARRFVVQKLFAALFTVSLVSFTSGCNEPAPRGAGTSKGGDTRGAQADKVPRVEFTFQHVDSSAWWKSCLEVSTNDGGRPFVLGCNKDHGDQKAVVAGAKPMVINEVVQGQTQQLTLHFETFKNKPGTCGDKPCEYDTKGTLRSSDRPKDVKSFFCVKKGPNKYSIYFEDQVDENFERDTLYRSYLRMADGSKVPKFDPFHKTPKLTEQYTIIPEAKDKIDMKYLGNKEKPTEQDLQSNIGIDYGNFLMEVEGINLDIQINGLTTACSE